MNKSFLPVSKATCLLAGVPLFCLAVGDALAAHPNNWNGPQRALNGGVSVVDLATRTIVDQNGQFDVSGSGTTPLSHGTPAQVTPANLTSWGQAHQGTGASYASVAPTTETLRASMAVASQAGKYVGGGASTSFHGQEIYVAPGSSGLSVGTPITLQFTFHIDGLLSVGRLASTATGLAFAPPSVYEMGSSTRADMRYWVYDLDAGWETAALSMVFGADANYAYRKDETTDSLVDSLRTWGNVITDTAVLELPYVNEDRSVSPVPAMGYVFGQQRDHVVDTGLFSIDLSTRVGHTLMIDSDMSVSAAAWGIVPMAALSDFGSTFDTEITTTVAGVELVGIQAGVVPVPEPETWAMLLAGLGLVGAPVCRRAGCARP